jgi:hypothetical protein
MPSTRVIADHQLRNPGTGLQALANEGYATAARLLAQHIVRHPVVRSITLRRSAAIGEVRFGRSDIDLGIVLHHDCTTPAGARELYLLNRTVRRLRLVFPWLGQCEVHSADELAEWAELESFRVTCDLGSALLLSGRPVEYPCHAITATQAAYRTAFWFENYLPRAVRLGRRHNLWKFTLEMWNTVGLALGRLSTPCLSHRETLAAWRQSEPHVDLPTPSWSAIALWRRIMAFAAELYTALGSPLHDPPDLLMFKLVLPPSFSPRTLVVGTIDQLAERRRSLPSDAFPMTPAALGLYLEYVNPAFFERLPPAILDLGFKEPAALSWHAALRRWSCPILARKPGFALRGFGTSPRYILFAEKAAVARRLGMSTAKIHLEDLGPAAKAPQLFFDYFIHQYSNVLAVTHQAREQLVEQTSMTSR